MNIGKMRHRITFLKMLPVISENGFEGEISAENISVWAAVTNLHGREYFEAKAVQAENTLKFTIRYLPGLDLGMIILFRGKAYNITAIDNIKYRDRYVELQGVEVKMGGED